MHKDILSQLDKVLNQRRKTDPSVSYTSTLLTEGSDAILKKIGEEATETILASKSEKKEDIVHEIADLWFHSLVLLNYHDLSSKDILSELEQRFGLSGLDEKAQRKPRKID